MRVDEIISNKRPTFSVEFSPPRTPEGEKSLFETARQLRELEPDFVSVTYGAGGSTRDGTVEITRALKDDLGFETMAHLIAQARALYPKRQTRELTIIVGGLPFVIDPAVWKRIGADGTARSCLEVAEVVDRLVASPLS